MKPVWKWIIGIIAGIMLLLVVVGWYFSRNWKPIVEDKLTELIKNSSDSLYTLKYDDLKLNVVLGNVALVNAELIPDSAVYERLVAQKKAPNNRFHVKLDQLRINRIGILNILSNRKLNVRRVVLESPEIHLISEKHAFNDTVPAEKPKSIYENISGTLKSIDVNSIEMSTVNFKFTQLKDGKKSELQLDSVDFSLHDLLIDENSESDTSRVFFAKGIDLKVPKFEYELSDNIYKASFSNLLVNTDQKSVSVEDVSFAPKISKAEFFKRKKLNVTMAVLGFEEINLENVDFQQILQHKKAVVEKVFLKQGKVDLYTDKRYPRKPGSRIGQAPHQQLMKMKQIIDLDSVFIVNVDVAYHEFSGKYFREGSISFNGASGNITNVTNDTLALRKDQFMRADLGAKIMNAGKLNAKFGFDMLSKNGAYTYKGSLGAMQATAFNRILQPLLNVAIASGNIRKITFDMQGTDHRNWGDFRFDYDHLKIKLLNEDGTEVGNNKKVLSFVVNQILINDSNPDANEKYHIGKITNYRRDPKHSFFKTLWQSLLEGIKQTAGISKEREERLMGTAKTVTSTSKKTKTAVEKTGSFIKGMFRKKDKEPK